MKLFQIEEPDGSPLEPDGPGMAVGIELSPAKGAAVAVAVGGNAELLAGADGATRLALPDLRDAAALATLRSTTPRGARSKQRRKRRGSRCCASLRRARRRRWRRAPRRPMRRRWAPRSRLSKTQRVWHASGSNPTLPTHPFAVIASEAKQSPASNGARPAGDCFVALPRSSQRQLWSGESTCRIRTARIAPCRK